MICALPYDSQQFHTNTVTNRLIPDLRKSLDKGNIVRNESVVEKTAIKRILIAVIPKIVTTRSFYGLTSRLWLATRPPCADAAGNRSGHGVESTEMLATYSQVVSVSNFRWLKAKYQTELLLKAIGDFTTIVLHHYCYKHHVAELLLLSPKINRYHQNYWLLPRVCTDSFEAYNCYCYRSFFYTSWVRDYL